MASLNMEVIKRNGAREPVSFDKITERITKQCTGLIVNSTALAQKVVAQLYNGVRTSELDELTAQIAANLSTTNPDYGVVASRIIISNHQKNTSPSFSATVKELASQVAPNGEPFSYVSDELLTIVDKWGSVIDERIDYERDFLLDYFGFKTMEKSYLLKNSKGVVRERPQHLWMRVSLALWATADSLDRAFQTYDMMSTKRFTHATPTLFNAGTPHQQLSSCFLLSMDSDAIKGIYKTLGDCAVISKHAGGIGLHCSNIRAKGSIIRGTNGKSNGLVPMLRVFNNTARYVDQCFLADTLVYTMDEEEQKTVKKICLLKKGEVVLGSDGRYQTITKMLTHDYNGPICHIGMDGAGPEQTIKVTPEHPLLSIQAAAQGLKSFSEIRDRLNRGLLKISYNAVGELRPGDYVVTPGEMKITNAEYWSGFYLRRISAIEQHPFAGVLYDMEVEGTHDYTIVGLGVAHNGGGKRNGSFAIYLEPWHADVEDFLRLKLNGGAEEERARDLFYALWVPDLFMRRVEEGGTWTLFCPDEAPGLADCYGAEFDQLYERYEREGKGRRVVEAQKLWFQILDTQIETGTPYLCYKDAANSKSNQQNLGVIKSSNLCSEIIEYTDKNETAVCNLASMALPSYVDKAARTFDYDGFRKAVAVAVRNLNRVIDINYYPTPETRTSNMRHRPIGLGIQGLADVFALMRLSWESPEAARTNQLIFEHMYYAAVEASHEAAMNDTGSYSSFEGSPAHKGRLQPDLWGITPITEREGTLDWRTLRQKASLALANSLLIAPMPTASTSQILGFNECFEAFTTNIYTRRTLAGEFILVNKYLVAELAELGLWSEEMKQVIIAYNGSVQDIEAIPQDVRERYKTVWEIKQKTLIDMAAARGAFVCQSQSLNLFVSDPTYSKLTSMHFYAWKKGLKTGLYYLRTKAGVQAQKFTIDPKLLASIGSGAKKEEKKKESRQEMLDRLAREYEEEQAQGCTMCSG
jgi:ribonucleoside-diphosphate reductase alpha subunit